MSKNIKEIAEIAASWWADKIERPKFDNGSDSDNAGIASLLARLSVKQVEPEMREKFINELEATIEVKLNEKTYAPDIILAVDYQPCRELYDAAQASGINLTNFPWKTNMWITLNSISVRHGYRADIQYLYANKTYWKEKIESAKESLRLYKCGERSLSWIEDEDERKNTIAEYIAGYETEILFYQDNLEKTEE